MQFGDDYSRFYDSFYEEKDYPGEARFVLSRVARLVPADRPRSIPDLGCGTGRHLIEFVRSGHRVHGVDLSSQMLHIATNRLGELGPELAGRASFQNGDIRDVAVGQTFDAVFCLFHVLCYLHEREDILAAFANARRHARPGGAYLFDFWHGTAVMANPPALRERTITANGTRVRRVSRPEWDREKSLVTINYTIEMTDMASATSTIEHERHILRYLFPDEIRDWLALSGFETVEIGEWMTARVPTAGSFSTYVLAKAV